VRASVTPVSSGIHNREVFGNQYPLSFPAPPQQTKARFAGRAARGDHAAIDDPFHQDSPTRDVFIRRARVSTFCRKPAAKQTRDSELDSPLLLEIQAGPCNLVLVTPARQIRFEVSAE
jgi:hypothetical protein